jgi:hypothetical protein
VAKTHICKRKAVAAMYNTLEDLDTPKRMAVLHEFFAEDKSASCVRRFIRSWKGLENELRSRDNGGRRSIPTEIELRSRETPIIEKLTNSLVFINLLKDVTHLLVLNELVEKNPQFGPDLSNLRMELFLTIINYKAQGNSTEGEDPLDVWRIFPADSRDNDVARLLSLPIGAGDTPDG